MRPLKKFGQSFLTDVKIIRKIIKSAKLEQSDTVLEIGAGHGELTFPIAKKVKKVTAIEIDRKLCQALKKKLTFTCRGLIHQTRTGVINVAPTRPGNVEVIEGDILKINLRELIASEKGISDGNIKVIGNLPYYITTPILMKLFQEKELFSQLIVMVQREVADRMISNPGSKNYGALSIAAAYHTEIEKLFAVGKESFYPQPEVDSALVRMKLRKRPPVSVHNEELFPSFIKAVFGGRRKMLRNALLRIPSLDKEKVGKLLSDACIDPKVRAENISLEQFANIFNLIK